jgi:hypothetical protein
MNITQQRDPSMHDFKVQYNRIAEYIGKARIADVLRGSSPATER